AHHFEHLPTHPAPRRAGRAPDPTLSLLRLFLGPAVVGLAARAAFDLVAEDDLLRELVAGEVLAGLGEEIRGRRARAGAELHDRDHLLTPALARAPRDDGVEHGRVVLQRVLHLLGEDLLAARVDRHRVAAEHLDRAVLAVARAVAGHRPADAVD